MIKFYTSHCPQCIGIKMIMDKKGIKYEEINNEEEYLKVAKENNISTMPFAKVDNKILTARDLINWVNTQGGLI